jgi:outer membrane protein TolC
VRKAKAGIGADVDADSLIADRATAQANVVQLEAQLAVSRQTLLVLLGRAGAAPESCRSMARWATARCAGRPRPPRCWSAAPM